MDGEWRRWLLIVDARLLSRTHYQVDEPAFAEAIVVRCTSPVTSAYSDSVAERLVGEIRRRGKNFNAAAARYGVDLARGLSLINANNVWVENGHLVNLVAELGDRQWSDELPLTSRERLLYLRLFLEADGAAIIYLARLLVAKGTIPYPGADWSAIATGMFVEIYNSYLGASSAITDRTAYRQKLGRLKTRGYKGKSGPHQLFIHLQAMYRLGFVEREVVSNERQFRVSDKSLDRLEAFLEIVPGIEALENVVREQRYVEVGSRVYQMARKSETLDKENALNSIVSLYAKVTNTGVAICPLRPIIEAAQILSLTEESRFVAYGAMLGYLEEAHASHIRDIRFHQDRRGAIAFVKMSDDLLREYSKGVDSPTRRISD